jgi:hypothetical protein
MQPRGMPWQLVANSWHMALSAAAAHGQKGLAVHPVGPSNPHGIALLSYCVPGRLLRSLVMLAASMK